MPEDSIQQPNERFIEELTACQAQLFGYIMASVGNTDDSHDVLQKANVSLWRSFKNYDQKRPFIPWALTLTRFQILSYFRDRKREKLIFDSDVLEQMQNEAKSQIEDIPQRQQALRECLTHLRDEDRTLLALRYAHRKPIDHISNISGRSIDGVKSLLLRLRRSLGKCIDSKMSSPNSSRL